MSTVLPTFCCYLRAILTTTLCAGPRLKPKLELGMDSVLTEAAADWGYRQAGCLAVWLLGNMGTGHIRHRHRQSG